MRGKRAKHKKARKDSKYESELVYRFINKVMLHGKRSTAKALFYRALSGGAKKVGVDPVEFLEKIVNNLRPAMEVRARRVGGANYHIPVPVSPARQESLVIRWLVQAARAKSGDSFDKLLQHELVASYNEEGAAFTKKINVEKMAEANKAFAHFRW